MRRVEREIKGRLGEGYYEVFEKEIKKSKRFADNFEKISEGLKLSGEKIINYQTEVLQNQQSASTNARKLQRTFI